MDASQKRILTYLLLGGGALYILKKSSSTSEGESGSVSAGGDILSTISTGVTSVVKTLTGQKIPDFVAKMTPIAEQIQQTYGIDPLILISQAALESGWGLSQLSAQYNNLFGFTAGSWLSKGLPVVDLPTYEYISKPIEQVTYFETPGDILSKEAISPTRTKVKVHRYFRKYPTWYDSASDWARLITTASRYSSASQAAKVGDMGAYAQLVSAAGYATDPDYPGLLTKTGATVEEALV